MALRPEAWTMDRGGAKVPKGCVFRGDGPVRGRKGGKAVQRTGGEGAAVHRQRLGHRDSAKQPGWLQGVVGGGGGAVTGIRLRDRVGRRFPRGAHMGKPGLPVPVGSVVELPGQSVGLDLAWVSIEKPGGQVEDDGVCPRCVGIREANTAFQSRTRDDFSLAPSPS